MCSLTWVLYFYQKFRKLASGPLFQHDQVLADNWSPLYGFDLSTYAVFIASWLSKCQQTWWTVLGEKDIIHFENPVLTLIRNLLFIKSLPMVSSHKVIMGRCCSFLGYRRFSMKRVAVFAESCALFLAFESGRSFTCRIGSFICQ